MKSAIKIILFVIVITGLGIFIMYFVVLYRMGTNFVHDKPASPEYYDHVANRVSFSARYRGEKFDSLLEAFQRKNPAYLLPDSISPLSLGGSESCNCDCLPFRREIYFPSRPREVYLITFEYGDIEGGIIDIVYAGKGNGWKCIKSSKLDSTGKKRVEDRLESEIIKKLGE
jgi:hypothetical protein